MFFSSFTDVVPKAAVLAVGVHAAMNYFVIGPEVAARVVRADHMPVCEANFRDLATEAAGERIDALPRPTLDPAKEMATEGLRRLRKAPFMEELDRTGLSDLLGLNLALDMTGAQYEHEKRSAVDAYNRAVERIRSETATELGKAGSVCGCIADAAISETRTDWAIFTGTLAFFHPASLKTFDEKMASIQRTGRCVDAKAGS